MIMGVQLILMTTKDPNTLFHGQPMPALTTMLHRVCDNDEKKFDEATRIIELYIKETMRVMEERLSK